MGQLLGYARVSTDLQDPALQHDALERAGVDRVWTDHASGTVADRPQLAAVLDYARAGDVLVVWRLDRLGRSVQHLVATVTDLGARGVELRSLNEGIDTTTPAGRLTFHVFAAMAEFEAMVAGTRLRERRQTAHPQLVDSYACVPLPLRVRCGIQRSAPTLGHLKSRSSALAREMRRLQSGHNLH
ncbi:MULTISPECIES: recombinase family protein [unclassified Cellulomonas]|uniref:recombinase family protein n=1 Tax=unclassified Cellulomonas TaxID=2620175 RepID=UPI001C4E66E0|nr:MULTISPECIES: recombinase family protein [unclassified Cellulomonas]MBW0256330.1 recombinase family protein [Cellulomonas sp. PS-H5]MCG7284640.1 recombinase family protein [Cellulomonas sp. ACRRI]